MLSLGFVGGEDIDLLMERQKIMERVGLKPIRKKVAKMPLFDAKCSIIKNLLGREFCFYISHDLWIKTTSCLTVRQSSRNSKQM